MQDFEKLLSIAKRKNVYDQTNSWYEGSSTYLFGIKSEIDEVIEEIPQNRVAYLEDELADVLWDYLNILLSLETEANIDTQSVMARACRKYEQRINAIENGKSWHEIKEQQKAALAKEHNLTT